MAKQSGLGDNLYVDEYDISGDIMALDTISTSRATLPATGIDKSAMERMHGLRDGLIEATCFFNDAAGQAHDVLAALPTADTIVTYARGTSIGSPAASLVSKQNDYAGTRGDDGSLTFKTTFLPNGYGLEWGRLLTAGKRTDGSATNGTSLDYGASIGTTAFGLQMYVHLFAFTGTSVTVKVQSSTDNGAGDAFADITGATSGALTAVGKTRVATATNVNVERYLRVVTTGTFSNAVFAVNVIRNLAAPVF
jgi:hypothetical protein